MRTARVTVLFLCLLFAVARPGAAQTVAGIRAQGMANAFVGVADDASAVYWNPAGLAGGAFFSLVVDSSGAETLPGSRAEAGRRSGWLLALSTPALGLAYYRLAQDRVTPELTPDGPATRRETLVTHQGGVTLVQSLTDTIAVGATMKAVRGAAASIALPTRDREFALRGVDLIGRSSTRFDLDAGIMATGDLGRLGLVVRNVTEPAFRTSADDPRELRLERAVRAGGSLVLLPGWRLASDLDLTAVQGPFGDVREWALGSEGQVTRQLALRGGVRLNTAGDGGHAPSVSAGGSYAVYGSLLVDVHVTAGAETAFRGWGVAGRMVF